jgi:hypothetical protein
MSREAARAARAGVDPPLLEADATATLDEMMTVLTRSGFGERLRDGDWNLLRRRHYETPASSHIRGTASWRLCDAKRSLPPTDSELEFGRHTKPHFWGSTRVVITAIRLKPVWGARIRTGGLGHPKGRALPGCASPDRAMLGDSADRADEMERRPTRQRGDDDGRRNALDGEPNPTTA